jgi:hypothetical protein
MEGARAVAVDRYDSVRSTAGGHPLQLAPCIILAGNLVRHHRADLAANLP